MRDKHHPIVGHSEQARLLEGLVDERLGRHGRGGDPAPLELGPAALHAIRSANARRLLYPKEVFDDLAIASPA